MTPERKLAEEPSSLTDHEIRELLERLAPTRPATRAPGQTLWDVIDEIMAKVPEEEMARVPPSHLIDHVLYGSPVPDDE